MMGCPSTIETTRSTATSINIILPLTMAWVRSKKKEIVLVGNQPYRAWRYRWRRYKLRDAFPLILPISRRSLPSRTMIAAGCENKKMPYNTNHPIVGFTISSPFQKPHDLRIKQDERRNPRFPTETKSETTTTRGTNKSEFRSQVEVGSVDTKGQRRLVRDGACLQDCIPRWSKRFRKIYPLARPSIVGDQLNLLSRICLGFTLLVGVRVMLLKIDWLIDYLIDWFIHSLVEESCTRESPPNISSPFEYFTNTKN